MEYDTRRLNHSYALLVAEESPPYRSSTPPQSPTLPPGTVEHGQSLRLARALIEGASDASVDREVRAEKLRAFSKRAAATQATPDTDEALLQRLKHLVRSYDRNLAEQLGLFLRVDELQLWKKAGCRDCIHWMDLTLGIGRIGAFERLRVARALRSLPVIESLFAVGQLSWSKVRELTRVASSENEQALTAAALELSASETVELCRRWRHGDDSSTATEDDENKRALLAFDDRSLTWHQRDAFTTRITLDLPLESAAEFLKALEAQEDELRDEDAELPNSNSASDGTSCDDMREAKPMRRTARQLRADAALSMSNKALAHTGDPVASADRYRVFVNLDARVLANDVEPESTTTSGLPPERASIPGYGPIASATARRLASQARLTVIVTDIEGEVVATGQETRLFAPNAVRAITARDRCCQMPGCCRTRWLQAHHVVPWAEGGRTTVANGCLVCSSCHRRLHEEQLRLEKVASASVELSDDSMLTLKVEQQKRARRMCARIQRFRLVRVDGSVVAGPRRRSKSDTAHDSASFEIDNCEGKTGAVQYPRGNNHFDQLSNADEIEQFRFSKP